MPSSYAPAIAPLLADAAAAQQLGLSIRAGHSAELREELLDGLRSGPPGVAQAVR